MQIVKKILSTLLILTLFSCASIPANKVKLSDYPEVNKGEIKDVGLSYEYVDYGKNSPFNLAEFFAENMNDDKNKISRKFNHTISQELEKNLPQNQKDKNKSNGCMVKISSYKADDVMDGVCGLIFPITFLTLFTIPYYCQHNFEAKATLVSTSDNKILKEYYLKDKAHEVWSLLWFVADVIIPPLRKVGTTPENAAYKIEQTISQSLTRQILNDAATFPECQKK